MRRIFLVLPLLAVLSTAGELRPAETEMVRLLKRVRPSIVMVVTPNKKDLDMSGVVVSSDGVILTLRKPLLGSSGTLPDRVVVRLAGAKSVQDADVIDSDPETDTVLLRTKSARGKILRSGTLQVVQSGEWVLLVGNTFGAGRESTPSASLGVVSGIVKSRESIDELHISALVNPGSIGAPVIDFAGTLLGIVAPRITGAGGQTIVISIDRVRAAYRAKRSDGRNVFTARPAKRSTSKSMARAFGLVMADAAKKGAAVLVGVRAAPLAAGAEKTASADTPKEPPPSVGPPGKKRKPRGPRPPARVPGKLPAWDRSSGVIVSADGFILCPLRVTGWPGARHPMLVDLADGTELKADVAGIDERLRVALLRVSRKGLPVLQPAEKSSVRTGRFAIALGYPHTDPQRATPQVTIGIVSRTGALARMHPALRAVQTDAGIAGGNRGGPLVDIDGRLLGVILDVHDTNTQGYMTRMRGAYAGNAGLGFALPVDLLDEIVPRMKEGVEFKTVFFGVSTVATEEGLRIMSVVAKNRAGEATAAQQAKLKKDDVLVRLADRELTSSDDLRRALARYTVGDEIELVWTRAGKRMSAKVKLGAR
ncbi:MAG: trypsin-like peptidase domain-containing protein [Planctomycetota bacterium]|jgi:S1-C subfamily serine protease